MALEGGVGNIGVPELDGGVVGELGELEGVLGDAVTEGTPEEEITVALDAFCPDEQAHNDKPRKTARRDSTMSRFTDTSETLSGLQAVARLS